MTWKHPYKVKDLEWVEIDHGSPECKTIVGIYRINKAGNGGFCAVLGHVTLRDRTNGFTNFVNMEAAKAAANDHHKSMLLSQMEETQ